MGKEYAREVLILGEVVQLGPVMLFDNIEDVFKWTITGNVGDFAGTKDTSIMYNGGASMKLTTRVTNPAGSDWVKALRTSFQRPGKRYAIECIWRPENYLVTNWVTFQFEIHDGSYLYRGAIICDVEGSRWYYRRSDGGEVLLPTQLANPKEAAWHRLRLEFNEETGKYIKVIADGEEVDMTALSFEKVEMVAPVEFEVFIKVVNVGANTAVVYVDDFLLLEI